MRPNCDKRGTIHREFALRDAGPPVRRYRLADSSGSGRTSGPEYSALFEICSSKSTGQGPGQRPGPVRAGALLYRGGLAIRSTYRRFGGLSGLVVSPDGKRLTAISDRGSWFSAGILYDETGRLSGLTDGRIGALHSPRGNRLRGRAADAEALTVLSDGSALVAFERRHRNYRYPAGPHPLAGRPTLWPAPAGLAAAPFNGGAEPSPISAGAMFSC